MRLKDLTEKSVADMILEQYKKKYVKGMTENKALALLMVDPRRMIPELTLSVPHAAEYIFSRRKQLQAQGFQLPVVEHKLKYRHILTASPIVQVLMIPRGERATLLMSHPKFKRLAKKHAKKI